VWKLRASDKTLIQGLVNKCACVDKTALKSPLHRAAACIDCTKVLLEHGADVTISDMSGRQPLHIVVRKRDVAVVNYLLDSGAQSMLETYLLTRRR
jgi:ankyrin repeat protein